MNSLLEIDATTWLLIWLVVATVIGILLGAFICTPSSDESMVKRLRKAGL